jgi:acyl carrier protein
LTKEQVCEWILSWFRSRGKLHCALQDALAIDYLQSSLLTSLEIVEFVSDLEDHFGFQFSEADMQDPRFLTIGGLGELVEAALSQETLGETTPGKL